MESVILCSAENFDALAGLLAAGKIYAGSKMWFTSPPAQKVQQIIDSHPYLFPLVSGQDLQPQLDLVIMIGPCRFMDPVSCRKTLDRAADIHLFSPCHEDRELFPKARLYIQPVAAVTTILAEEIRRQEIHLTKLEASLLALGIYEYTHALTSPATTAADVAAVQYLWEIGIDLEVLRSGLWQGISKTGLPPVAEAVSEEKAMSGDGCSAIFPPLNPDPAEDDPDHRLISHNQEIHSSTPEPPDWLEWGSLLPLLTGKLPDRFRGKLLLVGQAAARRQSEVYLVGGVIRDLLLGRDPACDLDLVVIPEAIPLARDLQKCLGGKLIVYEHLGTSTLLLPGGMRLDLATARQELYPLPGSLPQVEPSSLKFDLYRRDFTINSIACSLLPATFGRLFDYFNGRRDLADGLLRTMYSLSFVDDPLRILRAVRFENRLGFRLEDNTGKCMKKAINGRVLEKVSRQRLNQEMGAIYSEPDPPGLLKRLSGLGALKFIYPRLQTVTGTWRRLEQIAQALILTRHWDWEQSPEPELAYLAALFCDMEEDGRVVLTGKLCLSRDKSRRILTACTNAPRVLHQLLRDSLSPSALVNLLQDLPPEALLLICALAGNNMVGGHLESYVNSFRQVRTRLGGRDLIEMGLPPGPVFQRILKGLKEAVLDGRVCSLEEEQNFVNSFIKKEA